MSTKEELIKREPPKEIDGTPVYVVRSPYPLRLRGETWYTLCPEDNKDGRLWEWSATSGRIIQTQDGD